jgi:hypothetical protein
MPAPPEGFPFAPFVPSGGLATGACFVWVAFIFLQLI